MNAFKVKLGIGIAALIAVLFASQVVYRRNVTILHDYTYGVLILSEELHNAEIFHSSMHSMIITSQLCAQDKGNSCEEYSVHRKEAESALQNLNRGHVMQGPASRYAGLQQPGATAKLIGDMRARFLSFQRELDTVYAGTADNAAGNVARAKRIFDEVFHQYYLKLHEHHGEEIAETRKAAHDIKVLTDTLFVFQLSLALLAGVAVLFYIDRVVLKIYSITEHYSQTDALTSLYNRRHLERYLAEEIRRAGRYNRQISLAMIDIDDFKKYNDAYGHQAGDTLIKDMAAIMKKCTRKTDRLIRYGGEEFLVILPETDKQSARAFAEKIRLEVALHNFLLPSGSRSRKMTVSIGVASFPDDGNTVNTIIGKADSLLYTAKSKGKNIVELEGA